MKTLTRLLLGRMTWIKPSHASNAARILAYAIRRRDRAKYNKTGKCPCCKGKKSPDINYIYRND